MYDYRLNFLIIVNEKIKFASSHIDEKPIHTL